MSSGGIIQNSTKFHLLYVSEILIIFHNYVATLVSSEKNLLKELEFVQITNNL